MQVKECMSTNVQVVTANTKVVAAAQKMRDGDFGSVPVIEGNQLIGMITDRDIAVRIVAEGIDLENAQVKEAMTSELLFCTTEQDIDDVAEMMGAHQVRRLPVLDENHALVGMISLGDISQSQSDEAENALREVSKPSQMDNQTRH